MTSRASRPRFGAGYRGDANARVAAPPLVLVADADPAVRALLDRALRYEGYEVELAGDGVDALRRIESHAPALVMLDLTMPRLDGLATCHRLRSTGNPVPILMLTARDDVRDRVTGLDAGADDYLVKPFFLPELLARIRALLRRTGHAGGCGPDADLLCLADLTLDRRARRVWRSGRLIDLTRTEFNLLELLLAHAEQVLTRPEIFERVWGCNLDGSSKSLDVYISYLRRKLEDGGAPRLVHTVRGVGFVAREDTPS
ncbi:MAG: two-component system, OmpR family, response regulator MprA [Mycobacteriales bacterium]